MRLFVIMLAAIAVIGCGQDNASSDGPITASGSSAAGAPNPPTEPEQAKL